MSAALDIRVMGRADLDRAAGWAAAEGWHPGLSDAVHLDLPEPNAEALRLAEDFGWQPAFETARMYTGPAPALDRAGLYGITTFELG